MKKKILLAFVFILLIFSGITVTANADSWLWPIPTNVSNCKTLSRGYWYNSSSDYHSGVDIAVPTGSKVMASKDGTVWKAYKGCGNYSCSYGTCSSNTCSGNALSSISNSGYCGESYGNSVFLKHDDGTISIYGHLSEVSVNAGDIVTQGQLLGKTGSSGHSTGPHLHFTITTKTSGYSKNSINNNPLNSGFSIGNNKTDLDNATITYIMQESIGITDTEAPTIEYLKDDTVVSSNSITVNFKLNDNVGVNRVWLVVYGPGATKEIGMSASNGKFSYTINTADYGGTGTYSVHIYAYDAAENRGEGRTGTIYSTYPSNCMLKTNKTIISVGDTVTFTISANYATEYAFGIGDGTNILVETGMLNINTYSYTFTKPGTYYVWGYASNSVGSVGISGTPYNVYGVIETATMSSSSKTIKSGDILTFTINADNATEYSFGIGDGKNILVETAFSADNTYSYTFSNAGIYYVWGYARNPIVSIGISGTAHEVYNSVEKAYISSSKEKVAIGDNVTFTINADNATEYSFGVGNGKDIILETGFSENNTLDFVFTKPGTYYIWGYARNPVSYASVNQIQTCIVVKSLNPYIETNIENSNSIHTIESKIYNIADSCNILIAAYNSNNKLVNIKIIPYENQESITSSLAGDIDKIKVMVWDSLTSGKPLCEAEVIEKSEFIEE